MTDVPNPSNAPSRAKVGGRGLIKSLKGHPPWLYAIVVVGAIAAAYMIRQRQNAANAAAMASSPDDTSSPFDGGTYDTTDYPGASQGAYFGGSVPGDEQNPDGQAWTPDQIGALIASTVGAVTSGLTPIIGGGGAPNVGGVEAHTVDDVPVGGGSQVYTPPPVYTPAVAPPPTPHAVASEPQPNLGAGIFYNPDRKLRYIVQNRKTSNYPRGHNFRGYESRLNRGDWGQGGWIPT